MSLMLIVACGAGLRFYHIGEAPPGLYRDEAFYGLDALRVLAGDLSIYFAANNGREGLFMYLLAASVAAFGRTPEALRLTSAVVGTLTLAAIYFAGRSMFSPRIGLLAAAILAINFWHLAISRVAFRAITLPLTLCVMMALIFAALRASELRSCLTYAALAGAAFGLTFYTYTSAQFTLPLVALYGLSLWVGSRRELFVQQGEVMRQRRRTSAAAFVVAGLVALAPLLLWLTQHADLYFNRAGQVSIFNPAINNGDAVGMLIANVGKAAGMFAFQGDRIWRHNLSLRPVFDGWLAVAFALGLAVCGRRWWRSWRSRFDSESLNAETNVAPQFVLLWLIMFLIPTVLAEDAPHYLRAIGALPAACLVAAVGMESGLAWLSRRGVFAGLTVFLRRTISPPAFVAALLLVLSGITTTADYFADYVNRALTRYWLEDHNVQLARWVNGFAQGSDGRAPLSPAHIWLDERLVNDNPALEFLADGRWTTITADARRKRDGSALAVTRPDASIALIVDPNHDWSAMRAALPPSVTLSVLEGPLAQGDRDPTPRRAFIGLLAERRPSASFDDDEAGAQFEQGIRLVSAQVQPSVQMDNFYTVTLIWSADEPVGEDYAIFVHWVRDGRLVVQSDSSPAKGYLPMPTWRPGDRIVDVHVLAVTGGAQPGDAISVGVYRREDNRRLQVLDGQGRPTADSVIIPSPR